MDKQMCREKSKILVQRTTRRRRELSIRMHRFEKHTRISDMEPKMTPTVLDGTTISPVTQPSPEPNADWEAVFAVQETAKCVTWRRWFSSFLYSY